MISPCSYCYIVQGLLPEGVDGEEVEGTSAHGDYIHGGNLQPIAGAATRGGGRGGIRHAGEPDILTYRTLLEEMCWEGRSEVAYDLLEELQQRKGAMKGRMHSDLLASLNWCLPAAALIASSCLKESLALSSSFPESLKLFFNYANEETSTAAFDQQ
ncbi:hypothetical protein ZIOFF_052807 [Zingiber officinale]|uniref:Uncharacterized protein n=1 Tax=Zingiber officinale TaxID=94328 RepID=A0A8J5FVX5_ZINOF|nr:hypothetical protein ZIOFF_052807 [Zingiber officinale]